MNEHRFPLRVYFEDTDAAGIVYYANYLRYAERARTEMMRQLGYCSSDMMQGPGQSVLAVRRCEADYLSPARLDDELEVRTRIVAIGGASLGLEQVVCRVPDEIVVARLAITLVHITLAGKPRRIGDDVRGALAGFISERRN
jgi:acyl-CoA thioester hydrolase